MKKYLFLLICLAMTGVLRAQHCDSIFNYRLDGYSFYPLSTIQLGDHSIVNLARQDTLIPNNQPQGCYHVFNKISRHGAKLLDSVLIKNTKASRNILMTRLHDNGNPYYEQYCNTYVNVVIDENLCKTDLNISFFNDDIVFNNDMAITVPLEDTIIDYYMKVCECFLDSNNDIVFQYSIPTRQDVVFVRFGIDGVLKQKTIYPHSVMPITNHSSMYEGWFVHGFKQSCKAPVKYLIYGTTAPNSVNPPDFIWYELDSSFNILKNHTILTSDPNTYPFIYNIASYNGMVGLEDGNYLVAREVQWDSEFVATGITKYDENCNEIKTVWFDAVEIYVGPLGIKEDNFIGIGLEKDDNGNVLYAYRCLIDSTLYFTIVKLDEDLNVKWQYFGMPIHRPFTFAIESIFGVKVLDGGGAIVFGQHIASGYPPFSTGLCMLMVDDDDVGVTEMDVALRPYLCYPNPVADRLNIKYSPDATPKTVELYDLQGRLIRTQTKNFETIDMQQLPAGTYTLRMVLDNGKTYSDRIVKQ